MEGLLEGYHAVKRLNISVARPFEFVNSLSVPLDRETAAAKLQAMRIKDVVCFSMICVVTQAKRATLG